MLTRRDFMRRIAGASLLATPAGLSLVASHGCASKARRPNIVVILADDLAYDALGHSGRFPFLETPNIDRLVNEGVRFRNAFVTTALCAPSRASFLMGCYASKHQVTDNDVLKSTDFDFGKMPTLPEILRASGYETAFVGKWHLGSAASPYGFDYWATLRGQGRYNGNALDVNGREIFEPEYVTDLLTRYATRWLLEDSSNAPFFLMLGHKAVHGPFHPAPRHQDRFNQVALPMPPSYQDDLSGKHPFVRRRALYGSGSAKLALEAEAIPPSVPPGPWDATNQDRMDYLRCILSVDESVGSILAALEDMGRAEDTVVVFTSDQGFFLGEHQLSGKNFMYESALRIPLIIRPTTEAGMPRVVDEMVLNIDLAPTLLDLADCEIPASMQGSSFANVLRGNDLPHSWREDFFYEHADFKRMPMMHGIRTTRWKLITYPGEDFVELYDLKSDPEELHNLAGQPSAAETLKSLTSRMRKLRDAAT